MSGNVPRSPHASRSGSFSRLLTQGHWRDLVLHVTAIALVPLSLIFVPMMLTLLHMDYNGVRATLGQPIPAILLIAFILAGVVHMQIGMKSIILDYVQGHGRAWALLANTCFAAFLGLACVYATLRISFT